MSRSRVHVRRALRSGPVVIGVAVAVAGCGSDSGGATTASAPSGAKKDASGMTVWNSEAQLVAAAKKEGEINLYMSPDFQEAAVAGFKARYPWAKVNVTALQSSEAATKLFTEINAGVDKADIANIKPAHVKQFRDISALGRVQVPNDALIPDAYWDKEHIQHPEMINAAVIIYNTKLLPGGGPKSLEELSQPQWKDKLAMDEPSESAGAATAAFVALKQFWKDDARWTKFLQSVAASKPRFVSSASDALDAVIRGDRAMCMCTYADYVAQKKEGAPLGVTFYDQGADENGIVVQNLIAVTPAKAPHPAMAALWLNWMESKQGGQAAFAATGRTPAVPLPGASAPPSGTKISPTNLLSDYYNNPDTYNDAFKKYL